MVDGVIDLMSSNSVSVALYNTNAHTVMKLYEVQVYANNVNVEALSVKCCVCGSRLTPEQLRGLLYVCHYELFE